MLAARAHEELSTYHREDDKYSDKSVETGLIGWLLLVAMTAFWTCSQALVALLMRCQLHSCVKKLC